MISDWKLKWHKIMNWEYWSLEAIYYPLFPAWLYFSIKARSFFFFNAANPSIKNGGMAMESKMDIYQLMPDDLRPETLLIKKYDNWSNVIGRLKNSKITFPFIVKPDIGMKAFGVVKIKSNDQLRSYLAKSPHHFLIQEYIPYKKEIGIFYARHPEEKHGKITGLVRKDFLSVIGDGRRSIRELIKQNPRSHIQLDRLTKQYGAKLDRVLKSSEEYILVPFGSHTRGAKFTDVTHQSNPELLQHIDEICSKVPGFYYGRLDVLYHSWEDLCAGKNFKIIEINGAGSEATHIYDPRHSIFFAWKEIIRHWNILYRISQANRRKGFRYLSFKEGTDMLKANSKLEAQLRTI